MIVFSDVHLREETADVVLGEVLPGLRQACLQHGRDPGGYCEAVCLGDFFHIRYKIDARIQNLVADEFRAWSEAGIHTRILPGNHDQYDVNGRNALELFNEIHHVDVYTQPTVDGDGVWIPYRRNPEDILRALQTLPRNVNLQGKLVLWMHHGVRGAWANDNIQNRDGLEPEKFEGFHIVLCGHYHKRQTVGRVHYVGSPYQTRADESGQAKGYCSFDGETLRYFDAIWGPRFHRLEVRAGETLDLSGVAPRDEVRVRTVGPGAERLAEELGKQLAGSGIERHTVTPEVEPPEARLDVQANATMDDYVRAYVAQFGGELDPNRLVATFKELVEA